MRMAFLFLFIFASLCGCVKRTISITSQPRGALVWVNDREMGRTPLEFTFLYYGEYDIRLELDGFEPVMAARWATSPAWDFPVLDFIVEAIPTDLESLVEWHFDLEQRNDNPQLLLSRARTLRDKSAGEGVE